MPGLKLESPSVTLRCSSLRDVHTEITAWDEIMDLIERRSASMIKTRLIMIAAAMLVSGAATIAATPAQAREHGRIVHAHGPHGGYVAGRHVSRQPGSTQVTRGAMSHDGYGYRQTRTTTQANGVIHNDVQRRYANGTQMNRTSTTTRNPDGSMTRSRARSGAGGNSQAGWSTIYRTDDGYVHSRAGSTSSGRGYAASRDVSVNDGSVTINRSASTSGGRVVTSSRTYPRSN